jgi:transcriptional regulator with XRE-family HTH domain
MIERWLKYLKTNVKNKRKELGITQQELANRSQLSMTTILKIEQGRSVDIKLSILDALGKGLKTKDPLDLLKDT